MKVTIRVMEYASEKDMPNIEIVFTSYESVRSLG